MTAYIFNFIFQSKKFFSEQWYKKTNFKQGEGILSVMSI